MSGKEGTTQRVQYPLTPEAKEVARYLVEAWDNQKIEQYFTLSDMTAGSEKPVQAKGGRGVLSTVNFAKPKLIFVAIHQGKLIIGGIYWLILIPIFTLFLGSCTSPDTRTIENLRNNPLPTPEFVDYLTTQTPFGKFYCGISIDEAVLWRPGDFADNLTQNIQQTAIMTVDGKQVTDLEIGHDLLSLVFEYDAQRNLVGTHGHITSVCFDLSDIPVGWHVATIEVKSTSGEVYSHMWAFEVVENSSNSTVTPR